MIPDRFLIKTNPRECTSDSQTLTEQLRELDAKYPKCQNSGRPIKNCTCGYCSPQVGRG